MNVEAVTSMLADFSPLPFTRLTEYAPGGNEGAMQKRAVELGLVIFRHWPEISPKVRLRKFTCEVCTYETDGRT
jgi:hypothetical protein